MEKIKIGTKVIYRGSWGSDTPKTATIKSIEWCANEGDKYGTPVKEISWEIKDKGVYDLSDGHWCYGYQIEKIVKRHKIVLEHTTQRTSVEKGWDLVKLEMFLSDNELDYLKYCIDIFKDNKMLNGALALCEFTHSLHCSRHHRYRIWNTFDSGEVNITIIN